MSFQLICSSQVIYGDIPFLVSAKTRRAQSKKQRHRDQHLGSGQGEDTQVLIHA
jgi:hypothetical protein